MSTTSGARAGRRGARRAGVALGLAWVAAAARLGAQEQPVGSLSRVGTGARAAGMANAFTALSDDGTAASWNPAGLAQLRKLEASIVLGAGKLNSRLHDWRSFDGRARFSDRQVRFTASELEFVSLAVPLRLFGRPLTAQAGWRRLYQLGRREVSAFERVPTAAAGPPALTFDTQADRSGGFDLWSGSLAAKLGPRLALGLSAEFWEADWSEATLRQQRRVSDGARLSDNLVLRSRVDGFALSGGLLWSLGRTSLGLVLRGPFHGSFGQHGLADPPAGERFEIDFDPREWRISLGSGAALGAAWHPAPLWTLTGDLAYERWSSAHVVATLEGRRQRVSFFDGQPLEATSTRDTLGLNLGAERLFPAAGYVIPLRFGLGYDPQGYRDALLRDPVNYLVLALGAGFNTNRVKFDAALQYRRARYGESARLALDPGDGPDAFGRRSERIWLFKVSAILRLDDPDALAEKLKRLRGGTPPSRPSARRRHAGD